MRLTYKLNEQEQEEHKTKYLKFEYFPIPDYCIEKGNYGRITSDMIYKKLGQLEDLMEKYEIESIEELEDTIKIKKALELAFKKYRG